MSRQSEKRGPAKVGAKAPLAERCDRLERRLRLALMGMVLLFALCLTAFAALWSFAEDARRQSATALGRLTSVKSVLGRLEARAPVAGPEGAVGARGAVGPEGPQGVAGPTGPGGALGPPRSDGRGWSPRARWPRR